MQLDELRDYCLSKKGVTESTPFGPDTLVFKVLDKIFALTGLDNPYHAVNLKCEPNYAMELREQYPAIKPGYHMNKKHWNTVEMDKLAENLLKKLIDHSYLLVAEGLNKKEKEQLAAL
jgi:predicted DNA-binding protein (MmcQ/YjbR family)